MTTFPLPAEYYRDAIQRESSRLAVAARDAGLDAPLSTCPGWDVAQLLSHMGVLHRWVAAMVASGSGERIDQDTIERAPDGPERIDWFEHGSLELVAALDLAGPKAPVWTFSGVGSASFWFRRMAQETMVHRIDVELASGLSSPIDALLAADGVDEYWSVQLGRKLPLRPIEELVGVISLSATDIDATWTVSLDRSAISHLDLDSPPDVTVTGPAEELLLFLWARGPLATSTVTGDRRSR